MKSKSLADFTNKQLCLPALLAQDPFDVLFELSCALQRAEVVSDPQPLFHAAREWRLASERDQFGTTGYAVGTLPSITHTRFAVARTRVCTWHAHTPPVYLVFLIAGSPDEPQIPGALIAALHQLVADPFTFREIHAAASGAGIMTALERVNVPHRGAVTAHPFSVGSAGQLAGRRRHD